MGDTAQTPDRPGFWQLLDEFGYRLTNHWSFNKMFGNASLAALWAVISITIAGPQAVWLVGIPRILMTVHLMLAFHMFSMVLIAYYMAAEMFRGSSPVGGDGDGARREDEAAD